MSANGDRIVADYLKRLDDALASLPRGRRRELVDEIAGHVAEARAELAAEREVDVHELLDRIGEPEEIAREARERFGVRAQRPGILEVGALVLLPIGGLIVPIVGWVVGVALLWGSAIWTTRDKLVGTLVVPGGLALPTFLALFSGFSEFCSQAVDPETGQTIPGSEVCTGGPPQLVETLAPILFVLLLAAPLATAIYLAVRMRRATAAPA